LACARYTVPYDGTVLVQACSDYFQAALTIIGNGTDAENASLPIVNGVLACGYMDSCNSQNPNLFDPLSQTT
jgi:hypothetical protein